MKGLRGLLVLRGIVAALLFVLPAVSLRAQTLKGTVLGTIADASHAIMPGVAVNITEVNTNFHRMETTNDSGFYAFANLDPGSYRVEVEQPGFRRMVRSDIALVANTTIRVDME